MSTHTLGIIDFDPEAVYGISVYAEAHSNYAKRYKESIKGYTIEQLLKEISDLEIDISSSHDCVLAIRIVKEIMEAIDSML